MAATKPKDRVKGPLRWTHVFALVSFGLAIAAFVMATSPWFFVPPLIVGALLALAGPAKKIAGGADAQIPGGPSTSASVDVRFDEGEEGES